MCVCAVISSKTILLTSINDVPPRNSPLVHEVIHHLQLAQPDRLEGRLDQAAAEEVERLGRVLAVAHVGTLDRDHLDDGLEDGGAQVGARGEADADYGAAGADVLCFFLLLVCAWEKEGGGDDRTYLCGLLEGFLVDGDEDDGVRA